MLHPGPSPAKSQRPWVLLIASRRVRLSVCLLQERTSTAQAVVTGHVMLKEHANRTAWSVACSDAGQCETALYTCAQLEYSRPVDLLQWGPGRL
mmetsp:Transcript_40675/g.68059  ORF Transcript_40675/g.68059 Transcript_40675/m.68059 type:complete len:94 (-) Transcript_40675:187-468(-)